MSFTQPVPRALVERRNAPESSICVQSTSVERLSDAPTRVNILSVSGTEAAFETEAVPRELFEPCAHAGTVEMLSYTTADYRPGAYGAEPDRSRVANVREEPGRGVSVDIDGRCVLAGNEIGGYGVFLSVFFFAGGDVG